MKLYEKFSRLSSRADSDCSDCNFVSCTKLGGSLSPKEVVQRYARGEITQPIAVSSPDVGFRCESAVTERGQAFEESRKLVTQIRQLKQLQPSVVDSLPESSAES